MPELLVKGTPNAGRRSRSPLPAVLHGDDENQRLVAWHVRPIFVFHHWTLIEPDWDMGASWDIICGEGGGVPLYFSRGGSPITQDGATDASRDRVGGGNLWLFPMERGLPKKKGPPMPSVRIHRTRGITPLN